MNWTVFGIAIFVVLIVTSFRFAQDQRTGLVQTPWWGLSLVLLAIAATLYGNFWVSLNWVHLFIGMVPWLSSSLVRDIGTKRLLARAKSIND